MAKICRVYVRRTLVRIAIAAAILFAAPAQAQEQTQPQEKKVVPFDGSQAFRYLLYLFDQEPVKKIEDLRSLDWKNTTIIVFGDPAPLAQIRRVTGSLKNFRNRGGTLLIATDRNDRRMLQGDFGIHITGQTVWGTEKNYLDLAQCPLITYGLKSKHPLFKGCSEAKGIATNHPSWMRVNAADLLRLASYSIPKRKSPNPRFPRRGGFPPKRGGFQIAAAPPFIVGTSGQSDPDNRVVIMAGHGVFMNGMMVQRNIDNFTFAYNAVHWLTNDRQRKRTLFIEEGKIHETFEVPMAVPITIPPIPPEEILKKLLEDPGKYLKWAWDNPGQAARILDIAARAAEKVTGELESKGFLANVMGKHVNGWVVVQALFAGLTLLLVMRGLMRLFGSRYKQERGVPLPERLVANRRNERPVLPLRIETMVVRGNMWETARLLARQWFEKHTGGATIEPPRVQLNGWWRRRRWQRRLNRLWDLAYGDNPTPVRPNALQILLDEMHKLDVAVTKRRVVLADVAA